MIGVFVTRWLCPAALAVLLLVAPILQAIAEEGGQPLRGVALVIGNSAYEHLSPLANPANDARAIEALLDRLGFETTLSSDRDARRLSRDLRDFVDDAEGADVAVLYYAGHGIEAGGENFLVPVDADLSALDAAAERLVPIAELMERLAATVPVAIVILDACRDSPFPPGAPVRLDPGADPLPLGEGGLAETRGFRALPRQQAAFTENLGQVVAFAAEPGHVALDGAPGANSPYAAALLRHFDAMAGAEFGTVMRMVAEEVYLKTSGAQRPWVNESLRRLLYLGAAPEGPEGPEGDILAERRGLLVTIAALPDIHRAQIERAAARGNVPMDALFAVLAAMGEEAPSDPVRLDAMLREQGQRIAAIMAERSALTSSDAELERLSRLAATAMDEGALSTALTLHEQAKARVAALSATIDDVEDEIRRRRIEYAAVFADSAAARELAFDYLGAAEDYDRAFEQVARWDAALAWKYRRLGVIARYRHGEYRGDTAALETILVERDAILRLAGASGEPAAESEASLQIANTLQLLGKQRSAPAPLTEAADLYERAIAGFEAAGDPHGLARARHNLAGALSALGNFDAGPERLEQAIALYQQLADETSFEASSSEWMIARLSLASALASLGERSADTAIMRRAMDVLAESVARVPREDDPLIWAMSQYALAGAMQFVGHRDGPARLLSESIQIGDAVLEVFTRDAFPLRWAAVHNNKGNAYQVLGFHMRDETVLRAAEYEYRDALEELRVERVPNDWAMTTNNLANVIKKLGDLTHDPARLDEAIALYRACMQVWTRELIPLSWASAMNNMGDALAIAGRKRGDAAALREAVAAFDAALEEWTRERVPYDWAVATNNRGGARVELGALEADAATIRSGIADIEAAWAFDRDLGVDDYDEYYRARLDDARQKLAAAGG